MTINRPGPARTRRIRLAALLAAAPLLLAACSGSGAVAPAAAAPPSMTIEVAPAADAGKIRPDKPVTVTAAEGTLERVEVTSSAGGPVEGEFSDGGTVWTSTGRLTPREQYRVLVGGTAASGEQVNHVSEFATRNVAPAKRLLASSIAPLDGSTVGVAYPLVVGFNQPVVDRETVTGALEVETSTGVEGAWYWIDSTHVHYRPKDFWPAGAEVTLDANLTGVPAGNGVWGSGDRTIAFTIGREQVINVDVKRRELTVVRDGKELRSYPVSTGRKGLETRNGIKVIMEKVTDKKWTDEAIDADEDYELYSDYAMRMTNSGEFIHDAPWNLGNIGSANTSHGCVGMTVADMRWLYGKTMVGDPVIVTGSPRPYTTIWNRYQDWNVDWKQWQTGNADLSDG